MRSEAERMQAEQCSSSTFNLFVGGWTTLMFLGLFIRPVFGYEKSIFKVQSKGKAHIFNLSPLQEQMVIRNRFSLSSSLPLSPPFPPSLSPPLSPSLFLYELCREGTINKAVKHGVRGLRAVLSIHRVDWEVWICSRSAWSLTARATILWSHPLQT